MGAFHGLTHLLMGDTQTRFIMLCPFLLLFTVSVTIVTGICYYHIVRISQWCMNIMLQYRDAARNGRGLISATVHIARTERKQRAEERRGRSIVRGGDEENGEETDEGCGVSATPNGAACTDLVVRDVEGDAVPLEGGAGDGLQRQKNNKRLTRDADNVPEIQEAASSPCQTNSTFEWDFGDEDEHAEKSRCPSSTMDSSSFSSLDDVLSPQNRTRDQHTPHYERQERFSSCKVWSNVYVLGVGAFCMLYGLQLENPLCNITFCAVHWLLAVGDFLYVHVIKNGLPHYRKGGYANMLTCGWDLRAMWRGMIVQSTQTPDGEPRSSVRTADYILLPFSLLLYGICLVFHTAHASYTDLGMHLRGNSTSITVMHVTLTAVGPIAFKFMQRPQNMVQTVEVASPVAGLIGICVLAVIGTASIDNTGCIFSQYVKTDNIQIDAMDYAVHVYPLAIIATLLLPIAATSALVATISASNSRRTIDVAAAAALFSIWRYQTSKDVAMEAIKSAHGGAGSEKFWEADICKKLSIVFYIFFLVCNVAHMHGTISMKSRPLPKYYDEEREERDFHRSGARAVVEMNKRSTRDRD